MSVGVIGVSHQTQLAFYFVGEVFKRLNAYKSTENGEKEGWRRGKEERNDGKMKGGERD